MNGSELLDIIGMADPAYIEAAGSDHAVKKNGSRIRLRVMAACLSLAIIGGISALGIFVSDKNSEIKKIAVENIEEISVRYDGVLLAQNLDLSEGYSPSVELRYSGSGGLDDPSGWSSLSVSAEYPDCAVVLNCSFEGKTDDGDTSAAVDFVEYGDILIEIYQEEPTPVYEYVHRAVFECGGVSYELLARSNSADRIYELLDRLMGEPGATADHDSDFSEFKEILGFKNCKVRVEETAPHFFTWRFYAETDGEERCIAEMSGYFDSNMPEAYSVDLDGDGTDELICNCVSGDGWQTVAVYRNRGGEIEKGCIREEFYDGLGAVNFGPGSFTERYDPVQGFVITYCTEAPEGADEPERKTAMFESGLENFEFGEGE